ncbi:MAG TPA: ATP-binding protein [Nitrososphaeraceae archaeon]|nr:ATP-binding protein [Nitrososphaeraceae archaeon]
MIVCGLPGVGKTTIAKDLAPLINAVVLSTDKIRKELIPNPTYKKQEKKLIYNVLLIVAKYLHQAGINCILDATFNTENSRKELRKKLGLSQEQICIVECICPDDIVISRLKDRKNDYSDADISIYKKMKRIYQPIKEEHIILDTNQQSTKTNVKEIVNQLLKKNKKK